MVRALASHHCGPGSNPGVDVICGLSLLLVLREVVLWVLRVFLSLQKSTFPNSSTTRNQVDDEPLCECATFKSMFIYYFFHLLFIYSQRPEQTAAGSFRYHCKSLQFCNFTLRSSVTVGATLNSVWQRLFQDNLVRRKMLINLYSYSD